MKHFGLLLFFFFSCFLFSSQATAKPNLKVCLIFDKAGHDDHGFNESAYKGFQKAMSSYLISSDSRIFEANADEQVDQALNGFARSKCELVISVGVNISEHVKTKVANYPKLKFLLIDDVGAGENVRSVSFREDEGSFLMGAIAAMKTKTRVIGIVGGMNIPLLQKMINGYKAGAHYVDPRVTVLTSFVGVTVAGWNDPSKAKQISLNLFSQGADVIFQAAGGSGLGVFDAVEEASTNKDPIKRYAIGCDSNQNSIKPGLVLTSMIKNITQVVLSSVDDMVEKNFKPGHIVYDVKNNGIDWALDSHNRSLFSISEIKKISKIKQNIISGVLVVSPVH